ncbi:hypothetical protein ABVK25_002670 [Lepraria finkii]|uniref:Uncharacterized protein n=1 Tax=Lepraria finkii TaxID=1340010 RepID=A0ABR4BIR8_9LECA
MWLNTFKAQIVNSSERCIFSLYKSKSIRRSDHPQSFTTIPDNAQNSPPRTVRSFAPKPLPKFTSKADKENFDLKASSNSKALPKLDKSTNKGDYRDILFDEVNGEVPCYDNAATIRRKFKILLEDKSTIPGTSKKWSQASMAAEMQELETRSHLVEYIKNTIGPSARSLGNFIKKTGQMGEGDSPYYYWSYVMLEKLRIYNGRRLSRTRLDETQKQGERKRSGLDVEKPAEMKPGTVWNEKPMPNTYPGSVKKRFVYALNTWSSDPTQRPGLSGPNFCTKVDPDSSPLADTIPLDPYEAHPAETQALYYPDDHSVYSDKLRHSCD